MALWASTSLLWYATCCKWSFSNDFNNSVLSSSLQTFMSEGGISKWPVVLWKSPVLEVLRKTKPILMLSAFPPNFTFPCLKMVNKSCPDLHAGTSSSGWRMNKEPCFNLNWNPSLILVFRVGSVSYMLIVLSSPTESTTVGVFAACEFWVVENS